MYHSTKTWEQAKSILDNNFYPSDESRMLGRGIYVSSTLRKTESYGPITFKLLVYPGRICLVDCQGHPRQKTWQSDFGSAWTPPNTPGMVRYQVVWFRNQLHTYLIFFINNMLNFQENCIKRPQQIHILGICRGFHLLPQSVRAKTRQVR